MDTVTRIYPQPDKHFCSNCGSTNVAYEPTPFGAEDCALVIKVYRCLDCGTIDVPDFDEVA